MTIVGNDASKKSGTFRDIRKKPLPPSPKDDGACGVSIFDFYQLESCIYPYMCPSKDLTNKRSIEITHLRQLASGESWLGCRCKQGIFLLFLRSSYASLITYFHNFFKRLIYFDSKGMSLM